ncbi:MAG: GNAT family N-acetyltransferase [Myxococcota bacterium]
MSSSVRAGAAASAPGQVRTAELADLEALVGLWIEITRHHQAFDPLFTLREDAEGEIRALLSGLLGDPQAAIFVFDEGGGVVGMSCARIDRAPPILREVERGEITDLGVARERRRRGIGRRLAEAALHWFRARGVERVEVRVAARNPEGQAFWRELGFSDHMSVLTRRDPGGGLG